MRNKAFLQRQTKSLTLPSTAAGSLVLCLNIDCDARGEVDVETIVRLYSLYGQYFTGQSYLTMLATDKDLAASNVTFEPGCRNFWHIHHGRNQILLCVAGEGWYQEEGKPAQRLKPGDVVNIPTEVKHWHGATKDSWFSHIVPMVMDKDAGVTWLEPVSDELYNALED